MERDENKQDLGSAQRPRRFEEREGESARINDENREERGRRRGRGEISGSSLQNMLENPQSAAGGSQAPGFDDLVTFERHRPRRRRHNGDLPGS